MAPSESIDALASALVARFLRANDYSETLGAFLREASLPPDVGRSSAEDTNNWTIQSLLEQKKTFDQSVDFERYGQDNQETDLWTIPAPSKPTVVQTPTSANLLAASVEQWQQQDDAESTASAQPYIVSAGADRQIHLLETAPGNASVASFAGMSDSPVLSYVSILQGRYILMTNMSGQLLLQHGSRTLGRRRDHTKYAIKVVAHEDQGDDDSSHSPSRNLWVATAGWDATVYLYRLTISDGDHEPAPVLEAPVARVKLASNPESLLFVRNVDSRKLLLLVSRRDSSYVYYYAVESAPTGATTSARDGEDETGQHPALPECRLLGRQNLAPHSNAWVAFSPAHMALSPHDPGLLAVATSTLPHLKLIIVRLLFPSTETETSGPAADGPVSQASQAFAALALQNREDAAILVQANTFASQTNYSTPQVAWRPDGSGVWVNGDDGVVRGIETKTGRVVVTLKDGHEPGCKVRTIWAGYVPVSQGNGEPVQEEWVISGGFDKRLVVWKV